MGALFPSPTTIDFGCRAGIYQTRAVAATPLMRWATVILITNMARAIPEDLTLPTVFTTPRWTAPGITITSAGWAVPILVWKPMVSGATLMDHTRSTRLTISGEIASIEWAGAAVLAFTRIMCLPPTQTIEGMA